MTEHLEPITEVLEGEVSLSALLYWRSSGHVASMRSCEDGVHRALPGKDYYDESPHLGEGGGGGRGGG